MVSPVVLSYLRENRARYSIEALRKKIIDSGYTVRDFNDAIASLDNEGVGRAPEVVPVSTGIKWMKIGGILGVVLLLINFANFVLDLAGIGTNSFFQGIGNAGVIIFLILLVVVTCLFLFGFFRLGKMASSKALRVSSLGIIIIIILLIVTVVGLTVSSSMTTLDPATFSSTMTGNAVIDLDGTSAGGPSFGLPTSFHVWSIVFIIFFLILMVFGWMFSIGLIKTGDKVRFSSTAGWLQLVLTVIGTVVFVYVAYLWILLLAGSFMALFSAGLSLAGMADFITFASKAVVVLSLVAMLFECLVLFAASKKFER